MARSYYTLLGVSRDAKTDEIKAAYRRRLKETHPDVSDSVDASERTQELIEAKSVLTDPQERTRYDQLGHAAYIQQIKPGTSHSSKSSAGSTESGDTQTQHQTTTAAETTTQQQSAETDSTAENQQQTNETADPDMADWYDRASRHVGGPEWTDEVTDDWHAWNTDGTYTVRRSDDTFQSLIFSSRSLVLLVSTFLVYPVLLFGALFPEFPLPVRFLIGLCAVFVVAFLQSIPEVGILVFGTWSLVLPAVLVSAEIPLLSPVSIGSLLAVFFPLGLSALTRVVIRPVRI